MNFSALTGWCEGTWKSKDDGALALEIVLGGDILPVERIVTPIIRDPSASLECNVRNLVSVLLWLHPGLLQTSLGIS